MLEEGRPIRGDVFTHHQTLIAKKTLRMPDAMVGVMGGPNKDDARAHLKKIGWTQKQIHDHETAQFAEGVESLQERALTGPESEKKEDIVHGMKKKLQGFKERYGAKAKQVMYAIATSRAKQLAEMLSEISPGGSEYQHGGSTEYHAWGNVTHPSNDAAKAARDAKAKEWKAQGHTVRKTMLRNQLHDPEGDSSSGHVYIAHKNPGWEHLKEERQVLDEATGMSFDGAVKDALSKGHKITYGTASNKWHVIGPSDKDYNTSFALKPHLARQHGEAAARRISVSPHAIHEAGEQGRHMPTFGEPASQQLNEVNIGPGSHKVFKAFLNKQSSSNKMFTTDGKTLSGNWLGGNNIAHHEGGKVHLHDMGSRSGQQVHRALKKHLSYDSHSDVPHYETVLNEEAPTAWEVRKNGKPLGVKETNYPYASKYWADRSQKTGHKFTLHPQMESVERVDEISLSLAHKVHDARIERGDEAQRQAVRGPYHNQAQKKANKEYEKADKTGRYIGRKNMALAFGKERFAKEEVEQILKGFVPQWRAADKEHALKLAALKKKQKSIPIFVKETEQLDELSKKTLTSYIKKAAPATTSDLRMGEKLFTHAGRIGMPEKKAAMWEKLGLKHSRRSETRTKGIQTAASKLAEAEHLDEAKVPHDLHVHFGGAWSLYSRHHSKKEALKKAEQISWPTRIMPTAPGAGTNPHDSHPALTEEKKQIGSNFIDFMRTSAKEAQRRKRHAKHMDKAKDKWDTGTRGKLDESIKEAQGHRVGDHTEHGMIINTTPTHAIVQSNKGDNAMSSRVPYENIHQNYTKNFRDAQLKEALVNEHGYVGFDHKGGRHEVEAQTPYEAEEKIRAKVKPPKSKRHLVHVTLAELDTPEGRKQVVHTPTMESVAAILKENYTTDRRYQGGYEIPHHEYTDFKAWGQVTHHSDAEAKAARDAKAKEWKQQGHKVTKSRSTNAIYDPDGPNTAQGNVYTARKHHQKG